MSKKSRERREKMDRMRQVKSNLELWSRVRLWDRVRETAKMNQPIDESDPAFGGDWQVFVIDEVIRSVCGDLITKYDESPSSAVLDEFKTCGVPVVTPFDRLWIEFNSTAYLPSVPVPNSYSWGAWLYKLEQSISVFVIRYSHSQNTLQLALSPIVVTDEAGFFKVATPRPGKTVAIESWLVTAFALKTMALLNCRNIVTVDHEPDPVDNAAYQRHFGVQMTKYKTLAVKTMSKRYDREGKSQQQFDVMPLHLRRGHFAHYTEDAPLFGKYTGTFWRPATAVGNAKNGVVVKDYKVQAPDRKAS